jgi:hypothetical protein
MLPCLAEPMQPGKEAAPGLIRHFTGMQKSKMKGEESGIKAWCGAKTLSGLCHKDAFYR